MIVFGNLPKGISRYWDLPPLNILGVPEIRWATTTTSGGDEIDEVNESPRCRKPPATRRRPAAMPR